jgi:hypothetical protein
MSSCRLELLETRSLLAAVVPTEYEQYMIELYNRARANPAQQAATFGIDLNEGLPAGFLSADAKQPLAVSMNLTDAARAQAAWLIANNTFSHYGPGGNTPQDRMIASDWPTSGDIFTRENAAITLSVFIGDYKSRLDSQFRLLFVDTTNPDGGRGHRIQMLEPGLKETGSGIGTGSYIYNGSTYQGFCSIQDMGASGTNTFLTGVAYTDAVYADQFFTPGEAMSGVTVKAVRNSDGAIFTVQTLSSGGYSLVLPAGTYTVTATGGALNSSVVTYNSVAIGSQNVKLDFTPTMAVVPPDPPPPDPEPDPDPPPPDPTPDPDPTPPAFATFANGKLTILGTAGDDKISISLANGIYTVTCSGSNPQSPLTFSANSILRIEVSLDAGNDTFNIGPGVWSVYVNGGLGNDTITGGDFSDTLSGAAGRDLVHGGGGDDRINGGQHNDSLFGEDGNDRIYGDDGLDQLFGAAGVDRLWGGAGDDLLDGGSSNDKLYAEAGNDTLLGQKQNDILDGGDGMDVCDFRTGDTKVKCESVV